MEKELILVDNTVLSNLAKKQDVASFKLQFRVMDFQTRNTKPGTHNMLYSNSSP